VYSVQKGGRLGVVYCALVVQSYCNTVSNANGGGNTRIIRIIDKLVQESFGRVNEYLVKAKSRCRRSAVFTDTDDFWGDELAYTRYSFTCFCVCKNQSSLDYPRPFALPTLLQYHYATFALYMTSPLPSLYMPHTIHYW